ncbi:MAG: DUF2225 domain-containing protein [Nanoarchaeota archaeon]|nr:DUF2225 domain-containing protein [Nanoarchaeota archaeon]MBU1445093.1 DUF2225 domain-containing protein [Nanoarchaeota archaeon]MBU2406552.1 DUF2225 domain-containing protein [Nanoarchaeota archaeon]MBU2420348.1 DUF2225 domain-containing protein [Nanoarchaeota archaeon]MBU2474956.1 DUF2225 domain-containing protein [Nanoarchaeota archaeon]
MLEKILNNGFVKGITAGVAGLLILGASVDANRDVVSGKTDYSVEVVQEAKATTALPYEHDCPICKGTVVGFDVLGTGYSGQETDFKRICTERSEPPRIYAFAYCGDCNIALYGDDFEEFNYDGDVMLRAMEESGIRNTIKDLKSPGLVEEARIAEVCYTAVGEPDENMAHFYLLGSWLAQDCGDTTAEKDFQRKAIPCFGYVSESNPGEWEPAYLVGELSRRIGDDETARIWFDKTKGIIDEEIPEEEKEWYHSFVDKQILEVELRGLSETEYIKIILEDEDPNTRDIAISKFEGNDLETIARRALQEVVLNDEYDLLRENAMGILVQNVREDMIPFFVEALQDSHPRVVQGAAYGLGELKAEEAVPTLIKRVENEDEYSNINYMVYLALRQIGTPEAIEAFDKAVESGVLHEWDIKMMDYDLEE